MREEIKQIRSKNTSLASLLEPTAIDQIEQLITTSNKALLQDVREAGPKDDPCPRRDGTKGNRAEQAWDSGFNSANDEWHTAINTVAKERGLS